MNISTRQLRRLTRRYQAEGTKGVISRKRGTRPNNAINKDIQHRALDLIERDFYDYGPTLAAEKLDEYHGIKISKETARQWMMMAGIWHANQKHPAKIHPSRERRSCVGELIQIDGSIHDWFGSKGPRCTLLVFIDDATSRLQKLYFCEQETTRDYFAAFKGYVEAYGVPRALYFDKHGVFKVNHKQMASEGVTQFGRMLKTLGVTPIFAHTPQAKGRVERANGTLQDRLVKALRFHHITDIESANRYIEGFRKEYNKRFAKPPRLLEDVHRRLTEQEVAHLDITFSIQTERVISKDLQVKHHKNVYQIKAPEQHHRLVRAKVTLCENINHEISIYHQGKSLNYEVYNKNTQADQLLNRAGVNLYLDKQQRQERYWRPSQTLPHHKPFNYV